MAYYESQIKKVKQRREQLLKLYEEQQQEAAEDDGEPESAGELGEEIE